MSKLLEMLKGQNFLITVLTLVTLFINYQGIPISSAQDLYTMFANKSIAELIAPIFTLSVNVLMKLYVKFKEGTLDFSVFSSTNFLAQSLTVVGLILGVFLGETGTAVVIAIITHVINFLFHTTLPVKTAPDTPKV